ncbi:hypothetical protein [Nonomuraea sp. GTA35]
MSANNRRPGGPLMLIRPDGYIAWTGTDPTDLHRPLAELTGPPAESPR